MWTVDKWEGYTHGVFTTLSFCIGKIAHSAQQTHKPIVLNLAKAKPAVRDRVRDRELTPNAVRGRPQILKISADGRQSADGSAVRTSLCATAKA